MSPYGQIEKKHYNSSSNSSSSSSSNNSRNSNSNNRAAAKKKKTSSGERWRVVRHSLDWAMCCICLRMTTSNSFCAGRKGQVE